MLNNQKMCYICGSTKMLEKHHIFGGARRKNSEKYGLTVYLCHYCHNEPPNGVHFNKENRLKLQAMGQRYFEQNYSLDFIKIFGRNYL